MRSMENSFQVIATNLLKKMAELFYDFIILQVSSLKQKKPHSELFLTAYEI